jgi:ATP-dependent DNA helicase PIF1
MIIYLIVMIQNLNSQQKKALKELLNTKKNIFLTGAAGTGKSYVIKLFREIKKMTNENVPIVASTGAASILVNGVTFNSYFGLGIMTGGIDATIDNALLSRTVVERIVYTDTIIVDEVSMISGEVFQAANLLCQKIKRNNKPFGGIRLILVGDFLQLGPYSETEKHDWVFLHPAWKKAGIKTTSLDIIMRTRDKDFLDILAKVRLGKVDKKVTTFLNKKVITEKLNLNCPRIFSRNWQVDEYNNKKLKELTTPLVQSKTMYIGESHFIEKMKENLVIPEVLELKKDALVMMRVNNFQDNYVNGTVGVIIGITPDVLTIKKLNGEIIQVKKHVFELLNGSGEVVAKAKNFPCILSWAITIQKSQGCSIDAAIISLDKLWLHGQAYTALSRLSSAKGLHILSWDKKSFIVDNKVLKFMKK